MRIHSIFFILALICFSSTAMAVEGDVQESFTRLNQCLAKNSSDCQPWLTASSNDIYTRFAGYGLLPCLPKNIAYISQETTANAVIVHASVTAKGKQQVMKLRFVQEAGLWKFDLPTTLQTGMGKDWQQKITMTEQLYVMLRQQMGPELNCSMLQNLIK